MTLEECTALVDEVMLAWLVAPEGERLSGETLLRWRRLPDIERAYFAALLAPYHDPHSMTRTRTVVLSEGGARADYTYDPPFPEPCSCGAAVFRLWNADACRCVRCLAAWPLRTIHPDYAPVSCGEPLDIDKKHIGHAVELLQSSDSEFPFAKGT